MKKTLLFNLFLFVGIANTFSQISDKPVTAQSTSLCPNDFTTITVDNSDVGIIYYLRNDADSSIIDGPVQGNGGTIQLNTGNIANTTTYHVYALDRGTALDFDGIDDQVDITPSLPLNDTTSFTVMGWFKTSQSNARILVLGAPFGISKYLQFQVHLGKLRYYSYDAPNVDEAYGSTMVNNGAWHHVAFIRDAVTDAVTIYLDGQLEVVDTVPVFHNNLTEVTLGAGYINYTYQGFSEITIDDLSIWNKPLTWNEVVNSISTGIQFTTSPNLLTYYDFEEGTGTATGDKSSNSYDGLMVNMDPVNDWVPGIGLSQNLILSTKPTINITTINTTIFDAGGTLLVASPSGTFQWLDCNNGYNPIPGEVTPIFAPSTSGSYAVEITDNGCVDTSSCLPVIILDVNMEINDKITVSPNPTNNFVNVVLEKNQTSVNYIVGTIDGRIIQQKQNITSNFTIDLSNESKGIYLLNIEDGSTNSVYKIIKQ